MSDRDLLIKHGPNWRAAFDALNLNRKPDFSGEEFNHIDLAGFDFRECDFTGAKFSEDCNLTECNFSEASMKECRFSDSVLVACSFSTANLEGSQFFDCQLKGANFQMAKHITEVMFAKCDLANAKMPEGFEFSGIERLNILEKKIKGQTTYIALIAFVLLAVYLEIITISPLHFNSGGNDSTAGLGPILKLPGIVGNQAFIALTVIILLQLTASTLLLHFYIKKAWHQFNIFPQIFPSGIPVESFWGISPWIHIVKTLKNGEFGNISRFRLRDFFIESVVCSFLATPAFIIFFLMIATFQIHSFNISTFIFICLSAVGYSTFRVFRSRGISYNRLLLGVLFLISLSVALKGFSVFIITSDVLSDLFSLEDVIKFSYFAVVCVCLVYSVFNLPRIFYNKFSFIHKSQRKFQEDPGYHWLYYFILPNVILVFIFLIFQNYAFEELSSKYSIFKSDYSNFDLSKVKKNSKDLDQSNENPDIVGAVFNQAHLNGAIFRNNFIDAGEFRDAKLKYSYFNDVSLREADLQNAKLMNSTINNTDFTGASLVDANFQEAKLLNVKFNFVNLEASDFTDAVLKHVSFENDILEKKSSKIIESPWYCQFDDSNHDYSIKNLKFSRTTFSNLA